MSYDRDRRKYQLPLLALGLGGALAAAGGVVVAAAVRRKLRAPVDQQEWNEALDGLGRVKDPLHLLQAISEKGLQHDLRKDVWPFLVGVFPLTSTSHDRDVLLNEMTSAYNQLLEQCQEMEKSLAEAIAIAHTPTFADRPPSEDHPPVPTEVVQFGEAHRIIILDAVRTDFKHRAYPTPPSATTPSSSSLPVPHDSFTNNPVASAWAGATKLVNVWFNGHFMSDAAMSRAPSIPGSSAGAGGGAVDSRSSGMQQVWCSEAAKKALAGASHLDVYRRLQARRLVACLSAYAVYDPQTGYCQGMSDLAAPFLVLMEDDAQAFWCFAALMSRVRQNFSTDEAGMWAQLSSLAGILEAYDRPLHHKLRQLGAVECHFAYRMILVMMRRELSMDKAMHLWEMIWAEALLTKQEQRVQGPPLVPQLPGPLTGHFGSSPWVALRSMSSVSDSGGPGVSSLQDDEWGMLLYVVAAVVWINRRRVLDDCQDHDHVLQLFSGVRVSATHALGRARLIRKRLEEESAARAAAEAAAGRGSAAPMPRANSAPLQGQGY